MNTNSMSVKQALSVPVEMRLRARHLVAIAAFYVFFAFQYWLVLWTTSGGTRNAWKEAVIDYFLLKTTLTLPLAWLYFKRLGFVPFKYKLLMHLVTGSLWVYCWFQLYRLIQDLRGGYYLQGDARWWDVYIPGLFYCIQFSLFHLYEFYLQVKEQKELRHQLAEAAMQAEINLLKSQMQPHFLFNTLNSISASVPRGMEKTREMIARLADTFRYSLRASSQEYVEIAQELGFIRDFLSLEKERFQDRLEVHFNTDHTLDAAFIPPMLIQPIVENSVRHGIEKRIDGGCITLDIYRFSGKVRVVVSDTGNGYLEKMNPLTKPKGTGLYNTRKRLMHLYGEPLIVESNLPHGTKVSFTIPLLTENEKK